MDRASLWPSFVEEWIVYRDDDIVVVDKPHGLATHAADDNVADDFVSRLKERLSDGRARSDVYLGVHQRLDKETSGLMVFTLRPEANRALAAQFEGRTMTKRYVACVARFSGRETTRWTHRLSAPQDDGLVRVVSGGKQAVTVVRPVAHSGDRSLLQIEIYTGRTHQIRAQAAASGVPIAGDRAYGGPDAPRLMLHASELGFSHPRSGAPMRFSSSAPDVFLSWLEGRENCVTFEGLESMLRSAALRRYGLGQSYGSDDPTTAFRLFHGKGDGREGFAVDVYDDWAVVSFYDFGTTEERDLVLDVVYGLGFDGVYVKHRPKQSNAIDPARKSDLSPSAPVRGRAAPEEFVIHESGLPFWVRLGDGMSTGLFLDQRENRRRLRALSSGTRVLNLFAYTCAFSVAAGAGGAAEVHNVDASGAALAWGERNVQSSGVGGRHYFHAWDVFERLKMYRRQREQFDVVISDPPSYSSTRSKRFSAAKDYRGLAEALAHVVAPGGTVLACTNLATLTQAQFRKDLRIGFGHAGREPRRLKDLRPPADFPPAFVDRPHLKTIEVSF